MPSPYGVEVCPPLLLLSRGCMICRSETCIQKFEVNMLLQDKSRLMGHQEVLKNKPEGNLHTSRRHYSIVHTFRVQLPTLASSRLEEGRATHMPAYGAHLHRILAFVHSRPHISSYSPVHDSKQRCSYLPPGVRAAPRPYMNTLNQHVCYPRATRM